MELLVHTSAGKHGTPTPVWAYLPRARHGHRRLVMPTGLYCDQTASNLTAPDIRGATLVTETPRYLAGSTPRAPALCDTSTSRVAWGSG